MPGWDFSNLEDAEPPGLPDGVERITSGPTPPAPQPPAAPAPEPELDQEVDEALTPVEFDVRCREPFIGLLHLGSLEQKVQLYGHWFDLRTPSQRERLQIGPAIRAYQDTLTGEIAWMTGYVAAFLVAIDGMKPPEAVLRGAALPSGVAERLNWVLETIASKDLVNLLYERCLLLDGQVREVLEAMEKA
jgi:hypothetical protein